MAMNRIDDIGVFRLDGDASLDRAVKDISDAIAAAREAGVRKLLVDSRDSGLARIGLADRHRMIREWADVGQGMVVVAMLASPGLLDPERFGITVAANFGLVSDVFTAEEPALAWLRSQA
jgi:hypothetical protein